jgi:hypothetical protein
MAGATMAAAPAAACSIAATRKPIAFQNGACERQLYRLIEFANLASSKTNDEIDALLEKSNLSSVSYRGDQDWNASNFVSEMRMTDGKLDERPMRIVELELVRQIKNRASYAFVIERRGMFVPADPEGCNGLWTHEEYRTNEKTAYLSEFVNNRLINFRDFSEWYV